MPRFTPARRYALACVVATAFVAAAADAHAATQSSGSAGAPPIVVDTDMDFDDAAALAYLARADRLGLVDLRAVTVETSGVAFAGRGLSHARCLLDKLGLGGVPVADATGATANNWPDFARALLDGIVEQGVRSDPSVPCPDAAGNGDAVELLRSAIGSSGRAVTLVTLGPLSAVAEALRQDSRLAARIERLYVMGGQLDWSRFGEQFFDAHDYNLWVDAAAAQAVLEALPGRVYMTSNEAAASVPLTEAFRLRLADDQTTPAAASVYAMASHPLLVGAEAEHNGGAYWWDPLNAVAATTRGVVRYEPRRIAIVQSGEHEGRTFTDPDGQLVHYGTSADADRFHTTFLDILNGRLQPPRPAAGSAAT